MNRRSIVVAIAMQAGLVAAAQATDYPWCGLSMEVGTPVCAYTTFEQCRMSARSCIENPRSGGAPRLLDTRRRRTRAGR